MFSDGAITSNFPSHFFDALLPATRPWSRPDGRADRALAEVVDDDSDDPTLRHVTCRQPERPRAASLAARGEVVGGLTG